MTFVESYATKLSHPWSKDLLLAKAQRYSDEMFSYTEADFRIGRTSTFVLEFVARATLSSISPTLLAEKEWENLYFSLGRIPIRTKFIPKSIGIGDVLSRLGKIFPAFPKELMGFAELHINRRNEELHTGETPFDETESNWLAQYYETVKALLSLMKLELSILMGPAESEYAEELILASKNESIKSVKKEVYDRKTAWNLKPLDETNSLSQQASIWSVRWEGHRVTCPACENVALVFGSPISEPTLEHDDHLVIETLDYQPIKFECHACGLKIVGASHLIVLGLGEIFTDTVTYDIADYYDGREYMRPDFIEDFNE